MVSRFISDDRTNALAESFERCSGCNSDAADRQASKKTDLAGPGMGDCDELEKILPWDYYSLLTPKDTQKAIFHLKRYIEDNLCKELGLMMVEVPLIVDAESEVNDMLDRDKHPIDAQVVQAAKK